MKKNNYKKYVLSILLFIIVLYMTFSILFKENDINEIINSILNVDYKYIIVGFFLVIFYFLLQGIYMKRMLNILNKDIPLHKGIFYSFAEFFFSGITPSSTGGQPVMLYYMVKDKISLSKSLIVLLIDTIYFKLIIVAFAISILIFKSDLIFSMNIVFIILYFVGLIVDLIIVIGGYLTMHNQKIILKIGKFIEFIKTKLKFKNNNSLEEKLVIYNKEIKKLKGNKRGLLNCFIIIILQRLCLFSVSYLIYRAFGFNDLSYLEIIILQISVQIAIEFVPLPGGTGISEYLMNVFYLTIFGIYCTTGMLLTRTLSFYLPLVLSAIFILIKYIKDNIKRVLKNKSK